MIVRNLGQEIWDAMEKEKEKRRMQNERLSKPNPSTTIRLETRVNELQNQAHLSPGEKMELEILLKKMWNI